MLRIDNMASENRGFDIRLLDSEVDLTALRELLKEYAASLTVDLTYQNFEVEMAGLPGDYAPPTGSFLLAELNSELVGCVAIRRVDERTCEMKRLYTTPRHRGAGIGRALVLSIVEEAMKLGYDVMKLDTHDEMAAAQNLYRSFGFTDAEPYFDSEIEGNAFMQLDLRSYRQNG